MDYENLFYNSALKDLDLANEILDLPFYDESSVLAHLSDAFDKLNLAYLFDEIGSITYQVAFMQIEKTIKKVIA